ncbi:MAG: hypothetical protein AAAB35_02485 [Phyllobacterium sp.]|uniref:hypothetical protein n=1 Tax=Phyllobacterium sp. TaxID=1871046 RepID=UPI0030F338E6
MIDPHSAWVISRGLIDVTLMVTWGCFGYLSWAVPAPLSTAITRRLASLSMWCAAILCLAVLIALPAQVASIGDGWCDIGGPGILEYWRDWQVCR